MVLPEKIPGQEARTGQISMIITSRDPGKARTPGRRTATAKTEAMMKQTVTAKTEAMTERTATARTEVMTERTATVRTEAMAEQTVTVKTAATAAMETDPGWNIQTAPMHRKNRDFGTEFKKNL